MHDIGYIVERSWMGAHHHTTHVEVRFHQQTAIYIWNIGPKYGTFFVDSVRKTWFYYIISWEWTTMFGWYSCEHSHVCFFCYFCGSVCCCLIRHSLWIAIKKLWSNLNYIWNSMFCIDNWLFFMCPVYTFLGKIGMCRSYMQIYGSKSLAPSSEILQRNTVYVHKK